MEVLRTVAPTGRRAVATPPGAATPSSHPHRLVRRSRAGHSYVELMASLMVIATAILPVMGLLIQSRRVSRQAQARTAAYNVARQQMESLRALPALARPSTTGEVNFSVPSTITNQFPQQEMNASYRVSTANPGSSGLLGALLLDNELQRITVRVRWRNCAAPTASQGSARAPWSEVRLVTLASREERGLL